MIPFATPLLLIPLLSCQDPVPQDPPRPVPQQKSWPSLENGDAKRIPALIKRTRAADETGPKARDELTALGPAVVPMLLHRLGRARGLDDETITAVITAVTDPAHGDLLARAMATPKVTQRILVSRRLSTFRDQGLEPVLVKGLNDKEPQVAFYCALGLLALGREEGLAPVHRYLVDRWREEGELVARNLSGRDDTDMALRVFTLMRDDSVEGKVAGLRLLRHLLPKEAAGLMIGFLDAEAGALKKEAINVLRVVVDRQPPLEKLTVFRAIELARRWKARL